MKMTFPMALGLLFVALKLMGYIDWSWWWVLCPFWLGLVVALLALVVLLIMRATETPQQRAARLLGEYAEALRKRS